MHAGLRFSSYPAQLQAVASNAILIQLSVQALRQRLLGLSVSSVLYVPFCSLSRLNCSSCSGISGEDSVVPDIAAAADHPTHRGDIQVMLLTLSALFFSH